MISSCDIVKGKARGAGGGADPIVEGMEDRGPEGGKQKGYARARAGEFRGRVFFQRDTRRAFGLSPREYRVARGRSVASRGRNAG